MIKKISIVLFVLCSVCMQSAQVQATIIGFDDSIRGLQSVTIGTDLDVSGPVTITDAIESRGTIKVFELSFHDGQHLKRFQPDDFVPGTFQVDPLNIGPDPLSMAVLSLTGKTLSKNLEADLQSGHIAVTSPAEIPPCRRLSGYSVQV
jgi:hypothetical protein